MATLLPSLSSDEEDFGKTFSKDVPEKDSINRKNDRQVPQTLKGEDLSDESSEDEVDAEFEFGGLLGEDDDGMNGGSFGGSALLSMPADGQTSTWSYQKTLELLEQQQGDGKGNMPGVERTQVASIISAVRNNILKQRQAARKKNDEPKSDENEESEENEENDNEETSDGDGSTDESDTEDEAVDDVETEMDQDILKERLTGRAQKERVKQIKNLNNLKNNEPIQDGDDDHHTDQESCPEDDHEKESDGEEDEEERQEAIKAAAFFDSEQNLEIQSTSEIEIFSQLNLSRPLLRGVASMGFVSPTQIQSRVIPIALAGRDICASAVTGSGKTAAFLLPVMERILQRSVGNSNASSTHCLILTPTRELAAQCISMMMAIGKFTKLRAALVVGGSKNINAQATELRTRPDIVIGTPGRVLDHLTNSSGVDFDDLEFLILDEADRLLDLGFYEEVHEIVKSCPIERQTLLFSATMSTKVDDLIKLSLKRPVRVRVSGKDKNLRDSAEAGVEVASRLEQEFVRVRSGNDGVNREAMLLALLTRTFCKRVIVFFDTKADAHRLMIICGLVGIKCTELHGNLTQTQRLEALESFREGEVDVLLATDLAARGLDISSVEVVINFEMPMNVDTYVHRIGRTARIGRRGKACTLISESRRKLMKEVMKDAEQKRRDLQKENNVMSKDTDASTGMIRSRTIPPAVVNHFVTKIDSLKEKIEEVKQAEMVAKLDRIAEMEAMKAQNVIEHRDEILSRPQKEWFASSSQKVSSHEAYKMKQQEIADKIGTGTHRMTRKKRRVREAKEELKRYQEEARQQQEESGLPTKKVITDKTIKSSARARKKVAASKEKEKNSKSHHEEVMERENKIKQKKKRKGVFASDSLGDSELFEDEKVAFAKKPKKVEETVRKSSYNFTEFDPNKSMRKGGKKGSKKFKSKSKFKRR